MRRLVLALLVLASLASVLQLPGAVARRPPHRATNDLPPVGAEPALGWTRPSRPNIVLITTDDQTMADLAVMPRTRRLLGDAGVSLTGVSPHPLCCPARAGILTGQYAQNHGVRSNLGRWGGYQALDGRSTLPGWLQQAGYTTSFLGKYLNGYGAANTHRPEPGWDRWGPSVRGVYDYFDFTAVGADGGLERRTDTLQTDYFTRRAVAEIETLARRQAPFFLWQSYVAPHAGSELGLENSWGAAGVAPRHRTMAMPPPVFDSAAFNEDDVSDKGLLIRSRKRMSARRVANIQRLQEDRWRALQAVDEGVARTVQALRRSGELGKTVILFTSDNGFLLGEHRYIGKTLGYEEALRVPFLARGPGIPAGHSYDVVAATVDIAPTLVAAAGARPGLTTDGVDLWPALAGAAAPERDTLLIQGGPLTPEQDVDGWSWRGVRTDRYTYIRYWAGGHEELYDRLHDPAQLESLTDDPDYEAVLAEMRRRLAELAGCAGRACRTVFGPVSAPVPALD